MSCLASLLFAHSLDATSDTGLTGDARHPSKGRFLQRPHVDLVFIAIHIDYAQFAGLILVKYIGPKTTLVNLNRCYIDLIVVSTNATQASLMGFIT
jgi:hypothetical protein